MCKENAVNHAVVELERWRHEHPEDRALTDDKRPPRFFPTREDVYASLPVRLTAR